MPADRNPAITDAPRHERDLGSRQRLVIENPSPCVDGGRYAAKRLSGQTCAIYADIFGDTHDEIRAVVLWRRADERDYSESEMRFFDNDRWKSEIPLTSNAEYLFTIQAWTDRFSSWLRDLRKRVEARQRVESEALEGAQMIESALKGLSGSEADLLRPAMAALRSCAGDPDKALAAVTDPAIEKSMSRHQGRPNAVTMDRTLRIFADRPRAEYGAWYEIFVRSQGRDSRKSATFADAQRRLADIRAMGFDVVYLAPIHPIGRTARKGPNNALKAGPEDPGCPWAIGNENGGHTDIDPALGTFEDFDRFVAKAKSLGLEVALDFAIQCSPDHPWVKEHPEWFSHRPDGSIKHAESPPMKYEDIYPVNFDSEDAAGLWQALLDVVLFWVGHGVRIFRVDNPHTKPFRFWEWMIAEIRKTHPDVVFLSEAFTRPKPMQALAKLGFSQSYTYFTWRNEKKEIVEYLTELSEPRMRDFYRPNFWVNTPDVLHAFLQTGGPGAFRIRAILAALTSPSWGVYSGFELCEGAGLPGTEEYLDSEKFEIRPRDWNAPGNIKSLITRLNSIRNEYGVFRELGNISFFPIDNDALLGFIKGDIITVLSLDPQGARDGWVTLPLEKIGMAAGSRFNVTDLLTGQTFNWGDRTWVRLDPSMPAHVLRIERSHP